MSGSKTELVTRSKRPGMDCTIDIFHEKTVGFSKNINDRSTYKLVRPSGRELHASGLIPENGAKGKEPYPMAPFLCPFARRIFSFSFHRQYRLNYDITIALNEITER